MRGGSTGLDVIRIHRAKLPEPLRHRLTRNTEELRTAGAGPETARRKWKHADAVRRAVGDLLATMATGIERCMYCGDNQGNAIDHFEPIAAAPLRTFDWHNHLLACSHCNSHEKRDLFPRAADGTPLLVDPTAEDPYQHLRLLLSVGEYEALSERGEATIEVFGLNRAVLARGRAMAFVRTRPLLRERQRFIQAGNLAEATEITESLRLQPFADVLSAMLRYRHLPGAAVVLGGPDVLEALDDPELDFWS